MRAPRAADPETYPEEMVTVHSNLHDLSDIATMRGPTVELQASGDQVAVTVGHGFGRTALTPAEWAELAAQRGDRPYVLVDTAPGRKPFVSPLRTYADAMAEFDREMAWPTRDRDYRPDTGRRLLVMSREDYLTAREKWGQS